VICHGINAGDVKKLQDAGIYTYNDLMMHTDKVLNYASDSEWVGSAYIRIAAMTTSYVLWTQVSKILILYTLFPPFHLVSYFGVLWNDSGFVRGKRCAADRRSSKSPALEPISFILKHISISFRLPHV
jgi:hypothetical protein